MLCLIPLALAACADRSVAYLRPGTDAVQARNDEARCQAQVRAALRSSTRERVDAARDGFDPAGAGRGLNNDMLQVRRSMESAASSRDQRDLLGSCMAGLGYTPR